MTVETGLNNEVEVHKAVQHCDEILGLMGQSLELGDHIDPREVSKLGKLYVVEYQQLGEILQQMPRFGEKYVTRLRHDANPNAIMGIQWAMRKGENFRAAKVVTDGMRRITRTVNLELGEVNLSDFKIVDLLTETAAFTQGVIDLDIDPNKAIIDVLSPLMNLGIYGHSNMDALFRLLTNLISNSRKITLEGFVNIETEISNGQVTITTTDSGPGFGSTFAKIGLDTCEVQIPLEDFLDRNNGRSGFFEAGLAGNGFGLGIVERMAKFAGAQVFITNPKLTDGAQTKIYLSVA